MFSNLYDVYEVVHETLINPLNLSIGISHSWLPDIIVSNVPSYIPNLRMYVSHLEYKRLTKGISCFGSMLYTYLCVYMYMGYKRIHIHHIYHIYSNLGVSKNDP